MALVSGTTADALAEGSASIAWVVAIDGYPSILTSVSPDAAVAAWAGTDWSSAIGGLFVELRNEQSGDPHDPFSGGGGRCILHVLGDRDDTFGIDVNRRGGGAWTTLGGTVDRNDTAFVLRNNTSFAAGPSEAHIGVECLGYSGTTSSTMTVTDRGLYTAVGCASTGSGGSRFADHHSVALDRNQVQSDPVISQQPRRWIGRRVYVYLHKRDGDGNLNSKANAELVFAGRVDSIADDPKSLCTVIRLKHVLDEISSGVVCRNPWGGTAMNGMFIATGQVFKFHDSKDHPSGTVKHANNLTVVASGASGANQINEGHYSLEEICAFINKWLGAELVATRIYGQYTWASPFQTEAGVRTIVDVLITNASDTTGDWEITMPAGVGSYLGIGGGEVPTFTGGTFAWHRGGFAANTAYRIAAPYIPWRMCVFSRGSGGGNLATFSIETENERGEFVDQYDLLPSIVKSGLDSSKEWGLFLVDEKLLIQASYDDGVLGDCYITPLGQSILADDQPFFTMGRRADEDAGPVTIRQVFDIEGSFEQVMNILHYNTGTPGYNHATYDTSAVGIGIGLPGGLLGEAFERSIANLPGAESMMRLRFDEPTSLKTLIGGELIARRAFPVWKNEGIVYQRWHTPVVSLAAFSLDESNKASPTSSTEDHRTPTLETAAYARPVVKFDFDPDFAFGRETRYRASMQLIDHVAIDDGGGDVVSPMTIKLRNTPTQDAALDVTKGYLATMPMTSRPSRFLTRSISLGLFNGIAPGDTCLVTDAYARDPLTGLRGISGRPAVVVRHTCDYGGPVPGSSEPRAFTGEIEVNFFDVNRGSAYGPSADVDETLSSGGYSAGYNSGTLRLRVKEHAYSESTAEVDAAYFDGTGFAILVIEKDPTNPAAPLFWQETVSGRSGNDLLLDGALTGWDPTKTYRVSFDLYSACTAVQRDAAFHADDATEMVESVEVPYHWCSTPEEGDWTYNTDQQTEFMPDMVAVDGSSLDIGHEASNIVAINNLHDHKTAHHSTFMWTEQPGSYSPGAWHTRYFGRHYFGLDQGSNAVFRYLTLAPWLWLNNSSGATTGYVRVTVSRDRPRDPIGVATSYSDPVWDSFYAQTTFSTTSTTPAIATSQDLQLNIKDLFWGMAYITVQTKDAFCRGLAKGREGARVLVL